MKYSHLFHRHQKKRLMFVFISIANEKLGIKGRECEGPKSLLIYSSNDGVMWRIHPSRIGRDPVTVNLLLLVLCALLLNI